jgi:hypothetical protein
MSDIAIQNNPARRLHTIVEQLKSRKNDNLDAAFANVLGVDVADYALLVKRIGHVYFLVDLSKRAVESIDGINHEKYIAPIVGDVQAMWTAISRHSKPEMSFLGNCGLIFTRCAS